MVQRLRVFNYAYILSITAQRFITQSLAIHIRIMHIDESAHSAI